MRKLKLTERLVSIYRLVLFFSDVHRFPSFSVIYGESSEIVMKLLLAKQHLSLCSFTWS